MNRQAAINLMSSSKTIEEWNVNRASVKAQTKDDVSIIRYIDSSGLVSKTLKKK